MLKVLITITSWQGAPPYPCHGPAPAKVLRPMEAFFLTSLFPVLPKENLKMVVFAGVRVSAWN